MKDLLSKEHYCHKIHTLLMKSIAYPSPCTDPPPTPAPPFLQENLDLPPSMIFKNPKPWWFEHSVS